jgi:hypothetical protein
VLARILLHQILVIHVGLYTRMADFTYQLLYSLRHIPSSQGSRLYSGGSCLYSGGSCLRSGALGFRRCLVAASQTSCSRSFSSLFLVLFSLLVNCIRGRASIPPSGKRLAELWYLFILANLSTRSIIIEFFL